MKTLIQKIHVEEQYSFACRITEHPILKPTGTNMKNAN